MLSNQSLDFIKFSRTEPMISCQPEGVKPEPSLTLARLDMNMGRLAVFVAEKEKPVWPNFEDSRHSASSRLAAGADDQQNG